VGPRASRGAIVATLDGDWTKNDPMFFADLISAIEKNFGRSSASGSRAGRESGFAGYTGFKSLQSRVGQLRAPNAKTHTARLKPADTKTKEKTGCAAAGSEGIPGAEVFPGNAVLFERAARFLPARSP